MISDNIVTNEWRDKVPYKEYGQFKVADMDKIAAEIVKERKASKQSMFITIAAIKSDKHKELNNTLRFCTDPNTGIMFGMMNGLMPDGNIRWRAVLLQEMNTFNLNFINDAITYAFIRMHPKVIGSPFQLGEPVYKIIDEDKIAAEKNSKYIMTGQALHIAKTMKKEHILAFGRYLGIFYQIDASAGIIRASLFEHAATNPFDFMEKYNNTNRKWFEVIKTAIVVGVITHDHDKGFRYKSISLGHMESEILNKFIAEPSLADSIKSETLKNDLTWKNLQKETEKEIDVSMITAPIPGQEMELEPQEEI